MWRNGQEATLNVKTKAGKAWVELQFGLGSPPISLHHLNIKVPVMALLLVNGVALGVKLSMSKEDTNYLSKVPKKETTIRKT